MSFQLFHKFDFHQFDPPTSSLAQLGANQTRQLSGIRFLPLESINVPASPIEATATASTRYDALRFSTVDRIKSATDAHI